MLENLPVPLLEGSTGWVIGPQKTASGSVLFCNDTHIDFSQPPVWFEAHMEYPGFSFYKNHLAGIPFGFVGHSKHHSLGLTMFENYDQDFYEEIRNPENPAQMLYVQEKRPIDIRTDTIRIKGRDPVLHQIESSIHGHVMNGVIPEIGVFTQNPVTSWWVYTQEPTQALEALWKMNHASNITDFEAALRLIHAPVLNIMYGDKAGNIAWWAAAKLPIRPPHINSKLFIDGSNPENEPLGWMPFEENPMSINPPPGPCGFFYRKGRKGRRKVRKEQIKTFVFSMSIFVSPVIRFRKRSQRTQRGSLRAQRFFKKSLSLLLRGSSKFIANLRKNSVSSCATVVFSVVFFFNRRRLQLSLHYFHQFHPMLRFFACKVLDLVTATEAVGG